MQETTPAGPAWLTRRLRADQVVILDGATGTELEARGVPMISKGWSVMAQLEYPEVLRTLHEDYLRAGASVIVANTFAAGRHMLEPGGAGDRVREAHHRAVEIAADARDAVGKQAAIAGSISCYMADDSDPHWIGRLRDTYDEQVELLVDAGVDLIALEMMERPRYAIPAARAAVASGLPVWAGVTARRTDAGLSTHDFADAMFIDIVRAMVAERIAAVCVMHTELPDVEPALDVVEDLWDGPIGVYPEAGFFEEPHWRLDRPVDVAEFAAAADKWVARGVRLIGGCCGFGADHIAALNQLH